MKLFIGFALAFWLICGFVGALWLGDTSARNILRGPISLVRAYKENPASLPGP